jgi:hypothetical protein
MEVYGMNNKLMGLGLGNTEPKPSGEEYHVTVTTQPSSGVIAVYVEGHPEAVLFIKPQEQLACLDIGGMPMLQKLINVHATLLIQTYVRQLYFGLNTRDLGEKFEDDD